MGVRKWMLVVSAVVLFAALAFTWTFAVQMARVEGMAMAPTLVDQDRLVVNMLTYRFADPQPGDIVMLRYPLDPARKFVKRVIAGGNDRVELRAGRVFVNDRLLEDSYVPSEFRSHDDWGPQVVPEAQYFVLGDRRSNSSDSRHWGFVPRHFIVGRIVSRWWPMGTARKF